MKGLQARIQAQIWKIYLLTTVLFSSSALSEPRGSWQDLLRAESSALKVPVTAKHHFLRNSTSPIWRIVWRDDSCALFLCASYLFLWVAQADSTSQLLCFCRHFIELSCHQPQSMCVYGRWNRRTDFTQCIWGFVTTWIAGSICEL